jgi:hypothetical protein
MPRPYGRDRAAEQEDGTVVLSAFRTKGWTEGTAVEWDGAIYEVHRIEEGSAGGVRYVLAPWDDRVLLRNFVRYGTDAPAPPSQLPQSARAFRDRWSALPDPLRILGTTFVFAVLLGWCFPFHLMGEGLSFLVHELGHTAVAILFGRMAVPAVIMTITFDQSRLAAALIALGIAFLAWRYRATPKWRVLFFGAAAIYPVVAFTSLHLDALHLAGHLAEAGVAALFFDRALSSGFFSNWERPVYAFFAWYLWFRNARLFLGVATSAEARTDYLTIAITGENDLVKVANAHGLDLAATAFVLFLVVALVPIAGLVAAFRQTRALP